MAQVDVSADLVFSNCGFACFKQLAGLGGQTTAALRLFAADQANCGEVARIFMMRVETVLAAAHAGVVGDVPLSDEYQREVQAYVMAYGGYSKQLLKRISDGVARASAAGRARARLWSRG